MLPSGATSLVCEWRRVKRTRILGLQFVNIYTPERPVTDSLPIRWSSKSLIGGIHNATSRKSSTGTGRLIEFFRRLKRKPGKPEAVTATAHKLTRLVFHLLSSRQEITKASSLSREEGCGPCRS